MSAIESALLSLAVAASKALFAGWLRGKTPGARRGETTAELLQRRVPQTLQHRRAERQFDQVADQVTERLQEYLRIEFRTVPENEVIAGALLARDLFGLVETNETLLLQSDLDAVNVEKELRSIGAVIIGNAALSSVGEVVFSKVLSETTAYVVDVFTALPDFKGRAAREMLRRETALARMVQEVLARLPKAGGQVKDSQPEDTAFETSYRRSIARKLDRLELFGVTLSEYSRRYALSVAYIGLTAVNVTSSVRAEDQPPRSGDSTGIDEIAARRVERLLGYGGQRILIAGEAGSGKTTLLQWLAVMAARKELSGGLQGWNELIPIYIPLRRYARGALPRPENYLHLVVPNIVGAMPKGWMHRLLQAERSLLLLDGLDELPPAKREEFQAWLEDLIRDFPQSTVVITSRPTAVGADWLAAQRISLSELQPMSLQDIKSLIDHWHQAVAKDTEDEDDLDELARYRENLKKVVEDRRPLRALATNPLICALMCALHRDRRAQLPRDRMELYKIALEMLLERRDRERKVPESEVHLALREKESLLEGFAYWLIRNGQSDATYEEAIGQVSATLRQIPQIVQRPTNVLDYLIERSGVIRSPTEGRIDFLHRSFQEYLAAKAAVKAADVPLLIRNADNDQWHEVIILAAGHARPMEAERLIRGLLNRKGSDNARTHRSMLLAMACLETATQLSPALRDQIESTISLVVPPRTRNDAAAIAAAGEVATPFLAVRSDLEPEAAAACVRALALIGTEDAMRVVEQYSGDSRSKVAKEVIDSWSFFPSREYAERVLSEAPLLRGSIDLSDSSYVKYLEILRRVRHVSAENLSPDQLRVVGALARLRRLTLSKIQSDNFRWLSNPRIESLAILDSSLFSWEGIEGASGLRRIALHTCNGSLQGSLMGLDVLETVDLYATSVDSLEALMPCSETLKTLLIRECPNLPSLRGINGLHGLEYLALEDNLGNLSMSQLRGMPNLRTIKIIGGYVTDLVSLAEIPTLEVVRLDKSYRNSLPLSELERRGIKVHFSGISS